MLRSALSNWREYLTPVSHQSTFEHTGKITPEEFIKAGDYLCHMFPTWDWNDQESNISFRDFLPKNKQFLVTRKVPSKVRAEEFVSVEETDIQNGDEYLMLESTRAVQGLQVGCNGQSASADIDEMLQEMDIEDGQSNDDILKLKPNYKRYYDLYISYSTTYRVPKMYLVGFNDDGIPLIPEQMFQDIAFDYRTKTATIEKLPFFKNFLISVSIHPCKHSNVMRILMEKVRTAKQHQKKTFQSAVDSSEEWEDLQDDLDSGIRVDQYLIIFLKFMTSVTPSIEHDYTMDGW